MKKANLPYKEKFSKASKVKIADLASLKDFLTTWEWPRGVHQTIGNSANSMLYAVEQSASFLS